MSDPDDLPIFRPRMGAGRKAASRTGAGSFRSALLARLARSVRGSQSSAGRSRVAVRRPDATARRVVVKAHVVRLNASGAKAAALHLRYIERDGVEKDGSKGVPYSARGQVRVETFEQPRPGEKHQFRLIVSPEDAADLDLTDLVRRLMARAERDLGRPLEWLAVNHYDTEHPHAHLVIRGVDRDGREVRLDRRYISNGLRWSAQEIATQELGPRHELEIKRAQFREVTQERFTSLDRELERLAPERRVEIRASEGPRRIAPSTLIARLQHLEGLQLAERIAPRKWSLVEGWQDQLRELGYRGDILKQIHAAVRGDPARYHVVREGEELRPAIPEAGGVVTGRVAHKGLSDELRGRLYAVIEAPTGHAYRLPLDPRSAENIRLGDIVSLATRPEKAVRQVDRHIADAARARGGVFALEDGGTNAGATPHRRRLRELERLGLAVADGPNRWTLAPNFLVKLGERHRGSTTKHRLCIRKETLSLSEQVRYRGPAWLDRIDPATLAPYGFGAELRMAVEERSGVLRQLGIVPDASVRLSALHELERRQVGAQVADTLELAFIASAPEGFRGRVQIHAAPSGASYVVITDNSHLVVLRSTSQVRKLQGKAVAILRDLRSGMAIRQDPDRGRDS